MLIKPGRITFQKCISKTCPKKYLGLSRNYILILYMYIQVRLYFWQKMISNKDGTKPPIIKDLRTFPMIPEMCFACSKDNKRPFAANAQLDKDGLSQILTCEDCKVSVHASELFPLYIPCLYMVKINWIALKYSLDIININMMIKNCQLDWIWFCLLALYYISKG